jgi:hypothetical protein
MTGAGSGKILRVGGTDVVDLLLAQHAQIEELFRTVRSAEGDAKRVAFEDLVHLLAVHETAEEEIVHPLAKTSIDAGPDVIEARLDEEREANKLLIELMEIGTESPEFDAQFDVLRLAVLQHARREERWEFMQLRAAQPQQQLAALATAVRAAEAAAPTRPMPGVAPPKEPPGPRTAVIEKIRSAIREAMQS